MIDLGQYDAVKTTATTDHDAIHARHRGRVRRLRASYDRLDELHKAVITLRDEFDSIAANEGVDFDNWVRHQHLITSEDYDEYLEFAQAHV